jgi:hypothetical protein
MAIVAYQLTRNNPSTIRSQAFRVSPDADVGQALGCDLGDASPQFRMSEAVLDPITATNIAPG